MSEIDQEYSKLHQAQIDDGGAGFYQSILAGLGIEYDPKIYEVEFPIDLALEKIREWAGKPLEPAEDGGDRN